MTPLRAVFFALGRDHASARVRGLVHLEALARAGVAVEFEVWGGTRRARRGRIAALSPSSVVVLQRVLPTAGELAALRRRAGGLVLDMDDAIHRRPDGRRSRGTLQGKFTATLSAVDVVVCGNERLRAELQGRHPRVRLVPSSAAPPQRLPTVQGGPSRPVRLVWTGCRATLPYLEGLGPVLARLGDRVQVEVVADARPRFPEGVRWRFHRWTAEVEEAVLGQADVGLYPLARDAWSLGKSGFKLHRYMAFGLPSVASPWGGGRELLRPPEAGWVARGPAEWLTALDRVVRDPELRRLTGRRAQAIALGPLALPDRSATLARILREAQRVAELRRKIGSFAT